jgi:perosamine synthetase
VIVHPPEWPVYDHAAQRRVAMLLRRGHTFDYAYGPELSELEVAFAARHRRRYALALSSGTAGLLAAFHALGFGPGDEVIVPDYTFFSTATPLLLLGVTPVLADARIPDGTIDPDQVAALISPRTVGIVMTHLWGYPCDVTALEAIAARHGLATVEDCSHAHGAFYHGRPAGSLCRVAIFSLGSHKAVSGGMGGMLLTDDVDVYSRACLVANFRHRTGLTIDAPAYEPYLYTGLGGNFRMTPLSAVLAASHLDSLDERVAARQRNMRALIEQISSLPGLREVPIESGCSTGAWYDGVVGVEDESAVTRDDLVDRLVANGLKVRAPAAKPLHFYPIFQGAHADWSPLAGPAGKAAGRANDRTFPRAHHLYDSWIRLPVNYLWDDEGRIVEPYVEAFRKVLAAA